MVSPRIALFSALLALGIQGCSKDPGTGPKEVKWDRETCERCRMVLSDRRHSAQVRFNQPNGRSRVRVFDDIGCAVIWLADNPLGEDASAQIWVTDWRNGDWIDARTATYLPGQVTPMEYGLGAQPESVQRGFDFEQAKIHVRQVERRFNIHGTHLEEATSRRGGAGASTDADAAEGGRGAGIGAGIGEEG